MADAPKAEVKIEHEIGEVSAEDIVAEAPGGAPDEGIETTVEEIENFGSLTEDAGESLFSTATGFAAAMAGATLGILAVSELVNRIVEFSGPIQAAMAQLDVAFTMIAIELGEKFAPIIVEVINLVVALLPLIMLVMDAFQQIKPIAKLLGILTKIVDGVIGILGKFGKTINPLTFVMDELLNGFVKLLEFLGFLEEEEKTKRGTIGGPIFSEQEVAADIARAGGGRGATQNAIANSNRALQQEVKRVGQQIENMNSNLEEVGEDITVNAQEINEEQKFREQQRVNQVQKVVIEKTVDEEVTDINKDWTEKNVEEIKQVTGCQLDANIGAFGILFG